MLKPEIRVVRDVLMVKNDRAPKRWLPDVQEEIKSLFGEGVRCRVRVFPHDNGQVLNKSGVTREIDRRSKEYNQSASVTASQVNGYSDDSNTLPGFIAEYDEPEEDNPEGYTVLWLTYSEKKERSDIAARELQSSFLSPEAVTTNTKEK